jgi:cupin fold WbuC family metalloprotein
MNNPISGLTALDDRFFEPLLAEAVLSPRKRAHRNLHADFNEPVQRTCIALAAGTYVRPHTHLQATKRELILSLRGRTAVLIFDAQGVVTERLTLNADQVSGIEIPPGVWHTVFPLTDTAVILEVKQGPYIPSDPVCFAEWAPAEGDAAVAEFLQWMIAAVRGDRFSSI